MAQVSGKKVNNVPASKNLGTKIDNIVSGNKVDAKLEYHKITDVEKTQLFGANKMTNYMGINDVGMDIFKAKKITGNELNVVDNPTIYKAKADMIANANVEIAKQEADKKKKNAPAAPAAAPAIEETPANA